MTKKPQMIVLAGPNGTGKTTIAFTILPKWGIDEFLNADEIARGLSPFNPERQRIAAGRILIRRLEECIQSGVNFALETTLSGNYLKRYIVLAKKHGYEVRLFFITTLSVAMNVERVEARVKEGGHDIPEHDIRRRFKRSHKMLKVIADVCDETLVYRNNTEQFALVAAKKNAYSWEVFDTDAWEIIK